MDLFSSLQDVLRCSICEAPVPNFYCEFCHINLCKSCVGDHLCDDSKEHRIVLFNKRRSTIECLQHPAKICELHCEQCSIPICILCVSSGEHDQHTKTEILNLFHIKRKLLQKDIQELEKSIYPRYQEAASNIVVQKATLTENSVRFKKHLHEQEKRWHTEINNITKIMHSQIDESVSVQYSNLDKQGELIGLKIGEISKIILDLKQISETDNVRHISAYISRNDELRKLPIQHEISLLTFQPHQIDKEQISKQFGFLSEKPMDLGKREDTMKPPDMQLRMLSANKSFIDEPQIIIDIKTEHVLSSVFCQNDDAFWTCGEDKNMKLHDLKGELQTSIQSKSGNIPWDVTVTRDGELVYSDRKDCSINIVKNTEIMQVIKLQGWKPRGVFSTSSNDLLVTMDSENYKQTKVVRYSGFSEKQNIQWDDKGMPLYTFGGLFNTKYLNENRNLDICVADNHAGAVVVVSAVGKLRFRYRGPSSRTMESFAPVGITTDSQSRILTSDINNDCIHILDLDGIILHYIANSNLHRPWGICVDTKDNLFVAVNEGRVKKIQYYK